MRRFSSKLQRGKIANTQLHKTWFTCLLFYRDTAFSIKTRIVRLGNRTWGRLDRKTDGWTGEMALALSFSGLVERSL